MGDETRVVTQMAMLRIIAGSIEVTAAFLMLKSGRVTTALQINGILGLIGPIILLSVSTLGIFSLAHQVHLSRLIVIALGVVLIFLGTR